MSKRKVEVVPYHPRWLVLFKEEEALLGKWFHEDEVLIHHIGSTSVPGLSAKPIIDVLLETVSIKLIDEATPMFEEAGYESKGENGIPGRRYFQKVDKQGNHLYHVHAFEKGNPEVQRHLVFRDYLRAHSEQAKKYGEIKEKAAAKHPDNIEAYMDEKDPYIKLIEQQAYVWKATD